MSARPSPIHALGDIRPGQRYLLGLSGAARATGLVLVATGIAQAIAALTSTGSIGAGLGTAAAGVALRALAAWAIPAISAQAAATLKSRTRTALLPALLRRPQGRTGSGSVLATVDLDGLDEYATGYLPALVDAAVVPPLVGAVILLQDPLSALILVLTVPLVPVFAALIGLHTRDRVELAAASLGRLADHLVELARGLPVLVGLGRLEEQSAALAAIDDEQRRRTNAVLRTAFLSSLALELIASISIALVAVTVGLRLLAGALPLEVGLAVLLLAPEIFGPLRAVGAAFHASEAGLEAQHRARALVDAVPDQDARSGTAGRVTVHDLDVRHPGRLDPTVEHLRFSSGPGTVTLLAGPSGVGKSTVLDLLAGRGAAIDTDAHLQGRIEVDPADVAWLPQHPRFAAGTVLGELEQYGATATEAHVALDEVGIDALADADPASCSPGELRRLAFARVLVRVHAGARTVLLDEPTAHLDAGSAARVRVLIRRLAAVQRATVVLVSHDPETAVLADRTVRLDPVGTPLPARAPALASPSVEARRHSIPQAAQGSTARGLLAVLRLDRGRFAAAVALSAAATATSIALLGVSAWLIVRAGQEPGITALSVAIIGVRAFGIGRSALRYGERLITHDTVLRSVARLRGLLWRSAAVRGPAGPAATTSTAAVQSLIVDADTVRDGVIRTVVPAAAAALALLAGAVALAAVLPAAGAVGGALIVASAAVTVVVLVVGARLEKVAAPARIIATRSTVSLLEAADDLAGNALGAPAVEAARDAAARVDGLDARLRRVLAVASGLAVLLAGLAALGDLALGAAALRAGSLTPAAVAVLTLLPLGLLEPMQQLLAAAARWPRVAPALARIDANTAIPSWVPSTGGLPDLAPVTRLELHDLTAGYPHSAPVFEGITTAATRGEHVVITGPSGSGKSTLLMLLLRYLDPLAGSVLLDGTSARRVAPAAIRQRIAWCPQDAHLFDSSLRGNLLIAVPQGSAVDDGMLVRALRTVGLGELMRDLPAGLDTRVGANGSALSGGQRQRVAIARTLLAGADVVLLDEPTAFLDEQGAAELMTDLRAALHDRICVTVTHDSGLAASSDRHLELGRSPQQSSHRGNDEREGTSADGLAMVGG